MTTKTTLTAYAFAMAALFIATPVAALPVIPEVSVETHTVQVQSAQFYLDPGEFKGFDTSGKRQRVRIRTAGNGYTLQTLTGRNSGQVFYVHQGGNIYRAADGTTLEVTGRRSAIWNGWLGRIALND